jgi:predicted dehydrogenase
MKTTRRDFLASSGGVLAGAALTAAEVSPPPGAGKRLRIGMIGVGGRGSSHLAELVSLRDAAGVEITAVCDVWRPAREKAAAKVEKAWGRAPRLFSKVNDLLALPEVDAVVIATPDFSHAPILARAVRAGKDAYCEKPMATNLPDANEALKAVEETGRIIEVGTQRRSDGHHIAAVEVVRSGVLGTVSRVNFEVNFHEPRWKRSRKEMTDVSGADVDWEEFNLGRKGVPFEASRFREWQLDREFTSGIPGLWMSHFIDLVPWFLDDPFPRRVAALGGVYVWKDGRYTSDTFHALLEYPKGFLVSFAMALGNSAGGRCAIHGTNGTLDLESWTISGEGGAGPGKIKETRKIEPKGGGSHLKDFLDCLRTRGKPHADIRAGYSHAVATVMAAEALRTGETKGFDPSRRAIVTR